MGPPKYAPGHVKVAPLPPAPEAPPEEVDVSIMVNAMSGGPVFHTLVCYENDVKEAISKLNHHEFIPFYDCASGSVTVVNVSTIASIKYSRTNNEKEAF